MKPIHISFFLIMVGMTVRAEPPCVSKFQCVNTCSPDDVSTPLVYHRAYLQPTNAWESWKHETSPDTNCEEILKQYTACPNTRIESNITYNKCNCSTPYSNNLPQCSPTTSPCCNPKDSLPGNCTERCSEDPNLSPEEAS